MATGHRVPRSLIGAGAPVDLGVEIVEAVHSVGSRLDRCLVVGSEAEAVSRLVAASHPACAMETMPSADLCASPVRSPPFDCIVLLDDALDGIPNPDATLSVLAAALHADGFLIGVARPRGNAHRAVGTLLGRSSAPTGFDVTRQVLASLLESAGLEAFELRVLADPELAIALPLDGNRSGVALPEFSLRSATAEEIEELTAAAITFIARHSDPGPRPDVSIVVAWPDDAGGAGVLDAHLSAFAASGLSIDVELIVATTRDVEARAWHAVVVPELVRIPGLNDPVRLWRAGSLRARGRRIAFVSHRALPGTGWLAALWNWSELMATRGMAGSRILASNGLIEQAGYTIGPRLPHHAIPYPLLEGVDPESAVARRSRVVSGLALEGAMLDRQTFVAVGGLDRRFRGELLGVDLSLRVRSRGYQCHVVPGAVLNRPEAPARDRGRDVGRQARTRRRESRQIVNRWGGRFTDEDETLARMEGIDVSTLRLSAGARRPEPDIPLPIVWSGPFLDRTGYANEARNMVLALEGAGVDVHANPIAWGIPEPTLNRSDWQRLEELFIFEPPPDYVHVTHCLPTFDFGNGVSVIFRQVEGAAFSVGRTMFETDRLPDGWAELCNQMDQVWVPSSFNMETFARAGVREEKLRLVPSPIADQLFRADLEPLDLPGSETFSFLSVFAWGLRKGWDILVRAFVEEFERGEAKLILKVTPAAMSTVLDHQRRLQRFVVQTLGREPEGCPEMYFVDAEMGMDELSRLYRGADAFVLASRGEGWGRPYMEAMAAGLPTIGTNWSGNLEFMDGSNSYLIDCDVEDVPLEGVLEVHQYGGHRWGAPSVDHLRQLMRSVVDHPVEASERAARGRARVLADFSWKASAEIMVKTLSDARRPPAQRGRPRSEKPVVRWEGPAFIEFGMAVVNRGLCAELEDRGDVELVVEAGDDRQLSSTLDPALEPLERAARRITERPVDVTVRHAWPPDFTRPASGKLVVYQPWEYGALPTDWVEHLTESADEVWVPSRWVRDSYIRSGMSPRSVHVIPNGVDTDRFHPLNPPTPLPTRASFVFLFVGGALWRKGADILIDTYCDTFTSDDDVCLVIKDFGSTSFYKDQTLGMEISRLVEQPDAPEIVLIDWDLTTEAVAGLYTAADCLVHPYRGEGFGLPIAEAMASGCPVIVPRYGPCLDFASEETAFMVSTTEVHGTDASVGGLPTVDVPWWGEVDRRALADTMRSVVAEPLTAKQRGTRAATRIRSTHTWSDAADRVTERIAQLTGGTVQAGDAPARPRLSVCMIVKDESELLASALASVVDHADEIVVVDTGSTDDTVEIARTFGASVSHAPWTGSFAEARNVAIERAAGEWVLMLDADQRVEPASWPEIRRIIEVELPTAYLLRQWNYTTPTGNDSYIEHLIVRLFPNRPDVRYEGAVHEQVVCDDPTVGLQTAYADVVLHHDGYRPQYQNTMAKSGRDRVALEKAVSEAPDDGFTVYNLGMTYRALGQHEPAAIALIRAIELGIGGKTTFDPPGYVFHALVELGRTQLDLGQTTTGVASLERAVLAAPNSPDAWVALAAAYVMSARLEDALEAYRSVQSCPVMPAAAPTDRTLISWRGAVGEAQVLRLMGRCDEAAEILQQLLEGGWHDLSITVALAEVRRDQGNIDEAVGLLQGATSQGGVPTAVVELLDDLLRQWKD